LECAVMIETGYGKTEWGAKELELCFVIHILEKVRIQ